MRRRVRSAVYRARRYANKAARRARRFVLDLHNIPPETLRPSIETGVAFLMDTSFGGP